MGDFGEVRALADDVGVHLAAVWESGAFGEDFRAAGEGAPLDDGEFDVAAAPLVHDVFGGFVDIDGAGAGEGGAVVVDDVEVGEAFDAEDGADGVEGPVCGGAADAVGVAEVSSGGVFAAVDEVVVFGAGVGGGADHAVAVAEGVDRHVVAVFGFGAGAGDEGGAGGGGGEGFLAAEEAGVGVAS